MNSPKVNIPILRLLSGQRYQTGLSNISMRLRSQNCGMVESLRGRQYGSLHNGDP